MSHSLARRRRLACIQLEMKQIWYRRKNHSAERMRMRVKRKTDNKNQSRTFVVDPLNTKRETLMKNKNPKCVKELFRLEPCNCCLNYAQSWDLKIIPEFVASLFNEICDYSRSVAIFSQLHVEMQNAMQFCLRRHFQCDEENEEWEKGNQKKEMKNSC